MHGTLSGLDAYFLSPSGLLNVIVLYQPSWAREQESWRMRIAHLALASDEVERHLAQRPALAALQRALPSLSRIKHKPSSLIECCPWIGGQGGTHRAAGGRHH